MRDTYYQSAGNPLQLDRLPQERLSVELLPKQGAYSKESAGYQLASTLVLAAAVSGAVLVLFRPERMRMLGPHDVVIGGAIMMYMIGVAIANREKRWLAHPASLVGVALLCASQRVPVLLQAAFVSLYYASLISGFGRHWSHLCTLSPMLPSRANELRDRFTKQLSLLAAIGAALTIGLAITGWRILFFAVVSLPLAACFLPSPPGLTTPRWLVVRDALLSWFSFTSAGLPGLGTSPAGLGRERRFLVVACSMLTSILLVNMPNSPLIQLLEFGVEYSDSVIALSGQSRQEQVNGGALWWSGMLIGILSMPVALPWMLTLSLSYPILLEATAERDQFTEDSKSSTIYDVLRHSSNAVEKDSIYLGRVVRDGSPVLVPRRIFREHAHGLGDSGSGKTSLFLCPLIEQLIEGKACSVIVLDLKADTLELLASLQSARDKLRTVHGEDRPVRFFSNQRDRRTFAFNPMRQPFWRNFDLLTQTDILCGATGLTYGTDYGSGYFSSANAAILYHALKTFPFVSTFRELSDSIGMVLTQAKKHELHPEIRKAGVHVHEVVKRLAACEPLNVSESSGHPQDVLGSELDLSDLFRRPQMIYCHLSATLSPSGAPEIARLMTYLMLAAATQTERKVPVFLVIDEFQRIVASNLEYMLQLARSMGVGIILANQSMEDLKKGTTNLIPAIEANCRLRQWFAVSCAEDQERLAKVSGLTVDHEYNCSKSSNETGSSVSYGTSETVVPRLTVNDILLASDHPFQSILRISRGDGYAQFGGMPVIIESSYHISEEEYKKRRSLSWPDMPGSFLPSETSYDATSVKQPTTPEIFAGWSEEVIDDTVTSGGSKSSDGTARCGEFGPEIESMFNDFRASLSPKPQREEKPKGNRPTGPRRKKP